MEHIIETRRSRFLVLVMILGIATSSAKQLSLHQIVQEKDVQSLKSLDNTSFQHLPARLFYDKHERGLGAKSGKSRFFDYIHGGGEGDKQAYHQPRKTSKSQKTSKSGQTNTTQMTTKSSKSRSFKYIQDGEDQSNMIGKSSKSEQTKMTQKKAKSQKSSKSPIIVEQITKSSKSSKDSYPSSRLSQMPTLSAQPSSHPSYRPSSMPSPASSKQPPSEPTTFIPSSSPSFWPSIFMPSSKPSSIPSSQPSVLPSAQSSSAATESRKYFQSKVSCSQSDVDKYEDEESDVTKEHVVKYLYTVEVEGPDQIDEMTLQKLENLIMNSVAYTELECSRKLNALDTGNNQRDSSKRRRLQIVELSSLPKDNFVTSCTTTEGDDNTCGKYLGQLKARFTNEGKNKKEEEVEQNILGIIEYHMEKDTYLIPLNEMNDGANVVKISYVMEEQEEATTNNLQDMRRGDSGSMGIARKTAIAVSSILFLCCGFCVVCKRRRKNNFFPIVDDDDISFVSKEISTIAPTEKSEEEDYDPKAQLVEVNDCAEPQYFKLGSISSTHNVHACRSSLCNACRETSLRTMISWQRVSDLNTSS